MMSKQKKPKFNVGDTVVITINGTVGKITDIQFIGGQYVYKINKSKGYFLEDSLQMFSQINENIIEKEHVNINYKFFIGDIVKVDGYHSDLFKVIGFRTEIWRYKNDAWEDIIYELSRLKDGEWLEANEHELTFIIDELQANSLIEKMGVIDMNNIDKQILQLSDGADDPKQKSLNKKDRKKIIDDLLDKYNDYRYLYEMFADKKYDQQMKRIYQKLKNLTDHDEKNK